MSKARKIWVSFWLACGVARAFSLDCGRASTPVEQAICKQPDLMHLDTALNEVYARLRPQLAPKAQTEVVAQQRAWLANRNHYCANGDPGCLQRVYESRLEQLTALDAAAEAADGLLSNIHPLILEGKWKATAIHDPGGKDVRGHTDLPYSLSEAELPGLGALVSLAPGKFCVQGTECGRIAWTRTTLAKTDGAEAIHRVIGLPLSAPILVGNQGAKMAPLILLVPRDHGVMWAVFSLGGHRADDDDRYAAEEWTPMGPAATLAPLP